jgi:hypothetical protein
MKIRLVCIGLLCAAAMCMLPSVCHAQIISGRTPATSEAAQTVAVIPVTTLGNYRTIWIGAPITQATGAAANTSTVLIGDASRQGMALIPTDYKGYVFHIQGTLSAPIYIKTATTGDYVEWMILP